MRQNFTKRISFNGQPVLVVVLPEHRKDGMYYEININGFPRFYMTWSAIDRYDIVPEPGVKIPYELVLAVSDIIEENMK